MGFRFGFECPAPLFNNHMPLNGLPFRSLNPGLYLSEVYDKVHQMPALDLAHGKHVKEITVVVLLLLSLHTRGRAEGAVVIDGRGRVCRKSGRHTVAWTPLPYVQGYRETKVKFV